MVKYIVLLVVFLWGFSANAETQSPKLISQKYKISDIELCSNIGTYFVILGKVNSSPKLEAMGNDLVIKYLEIGGAKLGGVLKYNNYLLSRQSQMLSVKKYLDEQPQDKLTNFYVNCFSMTEK